MQPSLQLRLLGEFSLLSNGTPVQLASSARAQALLAYLALHGGASQTRAALAYRFWPDVTEAQARNNLRQTLFQLRRAWPGLEHFLAADANTLGWRTEAEIQVDVADFEQALAQADSAERRGDPAGVRASLQQAAEVYRGDLLPNFYDEWLEPERERLRQAFRSALVRLVPRLEADRAYAEAIRQAERLRQLDTLDEAAYASLMRLHALNNDRAAALRVYRECEASLGAELGVAPGAAVREIYERLLRMEAESTEAGPVWSTTWPLVGRQEEWARLLAAWRQAAGGQIALALVAGEAGIGKSRLAEELLVWASQQGIATARTRAYAAEGRLAFGPVADWLRSPAVRPSLWALPPQSATEVARLLPELLSERPELAAPEPLTEFWQRQRFFESLARAILSASQPLLLLIDDLQWCDPETLEWLHYLLRFDPQARLLLLATARAEDIGPPHPVNPLLLALQAAGRVTILPLTPLSQEDTLRLAASVAGQALAPQAALNLFRETEGNPLFVVETVRVGLDKSTPPLAREMPQGVPIPSGQVLPPRVQGVIATRLRQLSPPAGELVGLAATIGRAFSLDVLALAAGVHEADLARGLDELWQRLIIRELGPSLYDFSHDKLREVAYAEVSPPLRRLLHRRVAQALETAHGTARYTVSGQIAAHYEQAGLPAQAVPHYHQAATLALRVFAMDEAIGLLHKGLALLGQLPDTPQRQASELELQTALGAALVARLGYDSRPALAAYSRARLLCDMLRQPPSPPILRGLAIASIGRGNVLEAHTYGSQLRALAEHNHDPVLAVEAYYVHGVTWFWQGHFTTSRTLLEEALARYRPELASTHLALYSQEPKAICEIRLAMSLWCLGYPQQALAMMESALHFAQALVHPLTLGYTQVWSAVMHQHRHDVQKTRAQAEAMLALDEAHGVAYWVPFARVLRGWALAVEGDREAGWADIHAGLSALQAADRELFAPYLCGLQVDLHGRAGQTEVGLALLAETLSDIERKQELWCQAPLLRLQGRLRLQAGDAGASEQSLQQSLTVARQQQARSFELSAALDLARLWQSSGARDQARAVLAPVYHWFSEGLDLPELTEVADLLAQL